MAAAFFLHRVVCGEGAKSYGKGLHVERWPAPDHFRAGTLEHAQQIAGHASPRTERDRIEVRYAGAKEAVVKLVAQAQALNNDYGRFEALVEGEGSSG